MDADTTPIATLPAYARGAFNRCNLPAVILGGQTYQQHPVPLVIDGVVALHGAFFRGLDALDCADERGVHFRQYMCSAFLLGKSEEAGLCDDSSAIRRDKCDYLRLLRGWMFNADGIEAAVMKRWVESRFGLLTINHGGRLDDRHGHSYQTYQADYVRGLYNSNALESQLDLLYSFCQYELQRRWPKRSLWRLFRGINHIDEHSRVGERQDGQLALLLNNLNSFSDDPHLCEAFGDFILAMEVPVTKLLYFPELLTGVLRGEHEFIAIGGVYNATLIR